MFSLPVGLGVNCRSPRGSEEHQIAVDSTLDILNLHECKITSQQISVKCEDCSEELLAAATTVAKYGVVVHLDKGLSVHQLRKGVRQIGISKANLMKMQC